MSVVGTTPGANLDAVIIRRYRPEDAARVKAITAAAFAPVSIEAAVDRRWPGLAPVPWIERKWAAMQPQLADHPEHCWVAVATDDSGQWPVVSPRPPVRLRMGFTPIPALSQRERGRMVRSWGT